MNEKHLRQVVELAKSFVSTMRIEDSDWQVAYLRFAKFIGSTRMCASYSTSRGVELLSVIKHSDFFEKARPLGVCILDSLGKERGLFLLVLNENLDYEVKFEYDDPEKWGISKRDGASGIPIGL